ncbi:BlaI/MecI/CopY family transcriptional regulator [Phytomonospora endophytica]|uniref:Putative transcriptional regulator n=1 Tax=Phytomonospora endophytica TaxID=714109 RepID=A0A841FH60_9ACTN|nr:BlaI/MecI/CopY family transcriptional regulator [Phytomonospora endophytica]MBB6033178.1 putative transcriptional regulator [Phytomonospora endophytica]GIG65405.1 hypothetical protein Pen01_17000 [Phytomonospora endophytica]
MRGFGELEAVIMERLWAAEGWRTVREVLTELLEQRQLAYTTVMTVLDNLHKKGWLRKESAGKANRYTPVMTKEEYGAAQMRRALSDSGDPAVALLKFVGQMSPEEAAGLRAALDAHEGRDAR